MSYAAKPPISSRYPTKGAYKPSPTPYEMNEQRRQQGKTDRYNQYSPRTGDFWYLIGYFLDMDESDSHEDGRNQHIALIADIADPATVKDSIRMRYCG